MKQKNKLPQTPYDTVCVSGGFDPVHIGHLRMIQEASQYGEVIVIVNSDEWLMRKKGYIFMPFKERCEILRGDWSSLEYRRWQNSKLINTRR